MYNIIQIEETYYDLFGEYIINILKDNDMFLCYKRNNNIITLSLNQCKEILYIISNYVKINYIYLKDIIKLNDYEINLINVKKYSLLNLLLCSLYQLEENDINIEDEKYNKYIIETILCILDNLEDELIYKLKTIEDYKINSLNILYQLFKNVDNIKMLSLFNYYLQNINFYLSI